ncbi:MAG TPA: methyltransferase domain-containing protein [Rhodothermales bacterium]
MNDRWEGGSAYERFMGRWSRELAREFVHWLDVPPGGNWLEVGCGTGSLTAAILEMGRPASVVATDASEQYVEYARAAIPDERVRFLTAGADRLPTDPNYYDAVVSSLVLNFIPDPVAALREMRTRTAIGGFVSACVWDYAEGMEFLRWFWDAAVELDPEARAHDEGARFPICSPPALDEAFRKAGFSQISIDALVIPTHFPDFEDYWSPFVGGPGPAPGYLASLPADEQRALEQRLFETLPRDANGSIALRARAWVIRAEMA